MKVVTQEQVSSIVPEAIVNLYQAVNACTRIVRKTAENIEQVTDLGFEVMQLTLKDQRAQLLARQKTLLVN